MKAMTSKHTVQRFLDLAEIKIGGSNPWDIQVHDDRFYRRVLAHSSLGLGESFVEGWWDCEKLEEFYYRILKADLRNKVPGRDIWKAVLKARLVNLQKQSKAYEVGRHHYDFDNKLYEYMLDKQMVYSCGYWKNVDNLDDAQSAKLELTCRKIGLKAGMKVLDIGCGWGSFAGYAAENYGAEVVGVTISKEQVKLAEVRCQGLPVDIRLMDYRQLNETFDAIVSLGMFEHVGYKNYRTYMKLVNKCLKDDGLFLLHTIARNESVTYSDPWINKYIFPNSMLPSALQISEASEGLFVIEDWHNFGADYYKTLMAWHNNFEQNWDKLQDDYDTGFRRMWNHYLLSLAGGFKARTIHVWQIVFSNKGVEGGYNSIR